MSIKFVTKRNGEKEPLDINKIHTVLQWACEGVTGVSVSDIEMNASLQLVDGIKTSDIHQIMISSAADLISADRPDYEKVAGRLQLFELVKNVHGSYAYPTVAEQVRTGVDSGIYDPEFLELYDEQDFEELNKIIVHDRNLDFTFASIRQVIDKYLVQDRVSGEKFETPQFLYLLIAMVLFRRYHHARVDVTKEFPNGVMLIDRARRLEFIKRYYDDISLGNSNLPTPILCGVRTVLRQFASCALFDVGDSLDSIYAQDMALGRYIAQRSGVGINVGRVRGIGAKIRHGEVEHTGIIPFLKKFEATVKCCTQNGVRGGSATVYAPFWSWEIQDIIVLKSTSGTEENRVRHLDYGVQLNGIFLDRYLKNQDITLFSNEQVPELYGAFTNADGNLGEFARVYAMYEAKDGIRKRTVNARELLHEILKQRKDTGRIYIQFIDNANRHSAFLDPITMSNLCTEINLSTTPINHIDSLDGEIALCILSAINAGKIKNLDDLEETCELVVRALDEVIDYQDYPVEAARQSAVNRRSLGVGLVGVAHYLAKNGARYTDQKAIELMDELCEAVQYWLIKASVKLAKEKGPCGWFNQSTYSKGILPIDTAAPAAKALTNRSLRYDWEELREEVRTHGMRNTTLSAYMPSESSSVVLAETNGFEPVRNMDGVITKKSKAGLLKMCIPEFKKYKRFYQSGFDKGFNDGYLKVAAVAQKYCDQGMSLNTYESPVNYPDKIVPMSALVKTVIAAYQLGHFCLYYQNTRVDTSTDDHEEDTSCDSGACKI